MSEKSEAERETMINAFIVLTDVNVNHARSMLEAYQWDYDAAITAHFDGSDEENAAAAPSEGSLKKLPPRDTFQYSDKKVKGQSFQGNTSNIATLASLSTGDHEHSSSSNSDEEEGQAFYAGGSVHSGQQVLGPSKKTRAGFGIVKEMFNSAVRHGAEVVNPSENNPNAAKVLSFRGIGHVLGSTSNDSVAVSGAVDENSTNNQPLEVCLKAWRDGFSIDDGPLRDYRDPENKAFLDDVRKGVVPQELTRRMLNSQGQASYEGSINLSLEDHSHEDYKLPKQTLQAFSGTGYRLGSPTPAVIPSKSSSKYVENEEEAKAQLKIDESEPLTTIQVRLSDGSRLKIKVNDYHTVNDIRQYIVTARPEYGTSVFTLMNSSSYPMQEIIDDSLTIKEANLYNSVLVQRMK